VWSEATASHGKNTLDFALYHTYTCNNKQSLHQRYLYTNGA